MFMLKYKFNCLCNKMPLKVKILGAPTMNLHPLFASGQSMSFLHVSPLISFSS